MSEQETPVIFRKMHARHGGNVMAIFPADAASYDAYLCGSYEHVGQHSSCDPHHCILHSRRATPQEYASLKAELEGEPYGYRFRVLQRYGRQWLDARRRELDRIKAA